MNKRIAGFLLSQAAYPFNGTASGNHENSCKAVAKPRACPVQAGHHSDVRGIPWPPCNLLKASGTQWSFPLTLHHCNKLGMKSMRLILLPLLLLQVGLIFSPVGYAENYELGQGWHAGSYFISGYLNLEAVNRFDAPTKLDVDDLSLFVGGRVSNQVNPFAEFEISNATLSRQGGGGDNGEVVVERFYNDWILSEFDNLRVGKILTPLGDWNLVHAAPLIPMITRPYTTALGFNSYMSGIYWEHDPEDGANPSLQLYWQPNDEWFKRSTDLTTRNFHNVFGGHINLPRGLIDKIGASFQHGQFIETGENYALFGLNANKSFGKLRLEGEAITAHFSGTVLPAAAPRIHASESGIFALADCSVTPQWHGILESEYYQDHMMEASSRSTSITVAYRPSIPMVWKLEYIHQAGVSASIASIQTGWKAAFAVMF